jgi:hypothetical protein
MSDNKSGKINLVDVFKRLESETYCIIKLPNEFPGYLIGSDLDIFCYDVEKMARTILGIIGPEISDGFEIKVLNDKHQIYIDIMEGEDIHFRFDLYGELPLYRQLSIKNAFFTSVIEGSSSREFSGSVVKLPSMLDEAILRYIEYQEWYAERPDKIKHIEYLEEKIESGEVDVIKVLDKLHYYTEIPRVKKHRKNKKMKLSVKNMKKIISYLKNNGIKKTITRIKKVVFK